MNFACTLLMRWPSTPVVAALAEIATACTCCTGNSSPVSSEITVSAMSVLRDRRRGREDRLHAGADVDVRRDGAAVEDVRGTGHGNADREERDRRHRGEV